MVKRLAIFLFVGLACCCPVGSYEATDQNVLSDRPFDALSANERAKLRAYLDAQGARVDWPWTRVIKDDLDSDGKTDYLITVVLRQGGGTKGVRVFAIIQGLGADARFLTYSPENTSIRSFHTRRIVAIDFDGDGNKDIVERRSEDEEGYCLILKYDGQSLRKVFSTLGYSNDCSLIDLSGDGKLELVETTNEFQVPLDSRFLWQVVYEWRDGRWQPTPDAFTEFYRKKAQLYTKRLEGAREEAARYKEKTGKPNLLDEEIVKVMETYLARVKKFVGQK